MDHLHADVALDRDIARVTVDGGHGIAAQHLFGDDPLACGRYRAVVERVGQQACGCDRVIGQRPAREVERRDRTDQDRRWNGQLGGCRGRTRIEEERGELRRFRAVAVRRADFPLVEEAAADLAFQIATQGLDLVDIVRRVQEPGLHHRRRAVITPAERVGQHFVARIVEVERIGQVERAVGIFGDGDRAGLTRRGLGVVGVVASAGIRFEVGVVTVRTRIVGVNRQQRRVAEVVFGVEADFDSVGVARVVVVALHDIFVAERGLRHFAARNRFRTGNQRASTPGHRHFNAALLLDRLVVREEPVERHFELVVRLVGDIAKCRLARFQAAGGKILRTTKEIVAIGIRGVTPGLILAFLLRRRQDRAAQRNAQRAIGKLVRINTGQAIALVGDIGVLLARRIDFHFARNRQDAVVLRQRIDRQHVDRAGHALRQHVGGRGLDYVGAADQLGRDLVVLKTAVIGDGGDFATVEQRGGEVRAKPAQRQHVRTAIEPLGSDTRQLGKRIGDRIGGQLADVFGVDRFNHFDRQLLDQNGVVDRLAIAGYDDRGALVCGRSSRGRSIGRRCCLRQRRGGDRHRHHSHACTQCAF